MGNVQLSKPAIIIILLIAGDEMRTNCGYDSGFLCFFNMQQVILIYAYLGCMENIERSPLGLTLNIYSRIGMV